MLSQSIKVIDDGVAALGAFLNEFDDLYERRLGLVRNAARDRADKAMVNTLEQMGALIEVLKKTVTDGPNGGGA